MFIFHAKNHNNFFFSYLHLISETEFKEIIALIKNKELNFRQGQFSLILESRSKSMLSMFSDASYSMNFSHLSLKIINSHFFAIILTSNQLSLPGVAIRISGFDARLSNYPSKSMSTDKQGICEICIFNERFQHGSNLQSQLSRRQNNQSSMTNNPSMCFELIH